MTTYLAIICCILAILLVLLFCHNYNVHCALDDEMIFSNGLMRIIDKMKSGMLAGDEVERELDILTESVYGENTYDE